MKFLTNYVNIAPTLTTDKDLPMNTRTILIFASLAALFVGCGDSAKSTFGPGTFSKLTFTRSEGPAEFCPSANEIISLTVTKTASGDFKVTGKKAAEGDPVKDTCDSRTIKSMTCMVQKDIAEVTVEPDQALRICRPRSPACRPSSAAPTSSKTCTPCAILTIDVDGNKDTDQCCGTVNSTYTSSFSRLLVGKIERLVP